jgi:hypothetical protein
VLLAWTILSIGSLPVRVIAAAAGAPALVVLAVALAAGVPALLPWAIVSLGAAYAASLHGVAGIDGRAPVVGALLVLVAELGYWSLERRTPVGDESGLHARRAGAVLALTVAAAALGAALLALTEIPVGGSAAWDALGLAAAAGALATVALLSRRLS